MMKKRESLVLGICAAVLFSSPTASAFITLSSPTTYTQNFDTLASSGTSNTWTDNSTLAGWYSNRTTYRASTGSSTTGALYSFGTDSERALGGVASGGTGTINALVSFHNDSGAELSVSSLSVIGEQWRNSNSDTHSLSFEYLITSSQVDATNPDATGWSTQFTFISPTTGGSVGAIDGNLIANQTAFSDNPTSLTIAAGSYIAFRISDINSSGSDHGLAFDDLSVSFTAAVPEVNWAFPLGIGAVALVFARRRLGFSKK